MKNKKYLIIMLLALFVIFGIFTFQYIYKYSIIAEYQKQISSLNNYIMQTDDSMLYVKNDIYVLCTNGNNMYMLTDKQENKQYIITSTELKEIEKEEQGIVPDICSRFKLTNSNNIYDIIKADMWIKLSRETYDNMDCYKLETNSENTRCNFTLYFEANTKLPVAYKTENERLKEVKISVNAVTDEDVSIEALKNKLK